MLFLSDEVIEDEVIEYVVKMCCANSNYEVLIVGKYLTTVQQIFEHLMSVSQKKTSEFNRSTRIGCMSTIIFNNNSRITVVSDNPNNARGCKTHLLIADKNINYDLLPREFIRCEVLEDWDMLNKQVTSISDDLFEK